MAPPGSKQAQFARSGPWVTTPSATCRIESRRSMAVFWIQRNASGSVSFNCSCSTPLARSTALRVARLSWRSATSASRSGDLGESAHRHLDGGNQVALRERLDEIGHRAGVAGPLDEVTLREGGQDHHGCDALAGDLLGCGDPVENRHLHVQDHQVGSQALGQLDGPGTVGGLPDDVVPLLGQHLREIHPDQGFVLGDDDGAGGGVVSLGHRARLAAGHQVAFRPAPRYPNGRGSGLKHRPVWVRIPPGALLLVRGDVSEASPPPAKTLSAGGGTPAPRR